jgi:hypothetical protein
MIDRAVALHPTVSPSVGLSEKRAALDELRTAHRLLLATCVEDSGPTTWIAPVVALLHALVGRMYDSIRGSDSALHETEPLVDD